MDWTSTVKQNGLNILTLTFTPSVTANYNLIKLYALNTEIDFYNCWIISGFDN